MASVVAAGCCGGVLLCAPTVAGSSSSSSLSSSSLCRAGPFWDESSSLFASSSYLLHSFELRKGRRQRGRRCGTARASKDDESNSNQNPNNQGEKGPVDWDKAWSSYSKPLKKKSFLKIDMEKYVTRQPTHSNYPLSEEVDPLRKSERSALGFWTSLNFTYFLVFVIVGLAVYMIIIVGPPPRH